MDSSEMSGTNHFRIGPMMREVCRPENRSVEKTKMTPIQAATQIHGLIFGLFDGLLIVFERYQPGDITVSWMILLSFCILPLPGPLPLGEGVAVFTPLGQARSRLIPSPSGRRWPEAG